MNERKHLTSREIDHLMAAIKGSRNEARDRCLLLLMFRHGLRVSEACGLKLDQVDTENRVLHVARLKGGLSTTHPLRGDELRAIKAWLAKRARMKPDGKMFFVSEQRWPLHRSTVNLALKKYGELAALPLPVHPHMHASCLRLCPGRPGRRYAADSGLPGAPEHSAHSTLHRDQPSAV
jgi:type 1 fimbriae regulatory protein FimB